MLWALPDAAAGTALTVCCLAPFAAVCLRWQVIEVGVPFTDPMADGTTIQRANEVALANGIVGPATCISVVKEARKKGLKVPVVLMGYCNPFVM